MVFHWPESKVITFTLQFSPTNLLFFQDVSLHKMLILISICPTPIELSKFISKIIFFV